MVPDVHLKDSSSLELQQTPYRIARKTYPLEKRYYEDVPAGVRLPN